MVLLSLTYPLLACRLEATLGSPAGKKPLTENQDPQSMKNTIKKTGSSKVQWGEEEEGDIENQKASSSILNVNTPNAKLLKSANKSERKEILMDFWLSKGTITPKKLY